MLALAYWCGNREVTVRPESSMWSCFQQPADDALCFCNDPDHVTAPYRTDDIHSELYTTKAAQRPICCWNFSLTDARGRGGRAWGGGWACSGSLVFQSVAGGPIDPWLTWWGLNVSFFCRRISALSPWSSLAHRPAGVREQPASSFSHVSRPCELLLCFCRPPPRRSMVVSLKLFRIGS